MKVRTVECLPVYSGWRKNFVFVRIETDSGIVGWGEAYSQYDRDGAVGAQVQELGRYLVGRDPFQIRHFLQIAFDDYAQRRGSLEFYCATSGIEQALWDLLGKAMGQPVYNLLGGPCRSKIRIYADGWSYKLQNPEDYARAAEAVVKRGFTAMKFDPVPGPWRTYVPKEHIRCAVRVLRAIRDAVGPNVDLLLDIHRRLAPMHAVSIICRPRELERRSRQQPKDEAVRDEKRGNDDRGNEKRSPELTSAPGSQSPSALKHGIQKIPGAPNIEEPSHGQRSDYIRTQHDRRKHCQNRRDQIAIGRWSSELARQVLRHHACNEEGETDEAVGVDHYERRQRIRCRHRLQCGHKVEARDQPGSDKTHENT